MELVSKTIKRSKTKKQYTAQQLIKWYISDLEEYYPNITNNMKDYRNQISNMGAEASAELSLAIMKYCAFRTDNKKLRDMLTSRYVGAVSATILRNGNAKSIFDLVNFLQDLKADDERFANMNIDYKKYSQAMAETKDLKYNRFWVELFDEYAANYDVLINSNDPESAWFLASRLDLSKADFKYCEDLVLRAKNAELSYNFYDIKGANKAKHRKIVIDSKDSIINGHFLMGEKCTIKQVNQHKAAIYSSKDANKLKALVLAIMEKPELFSETEINDVIKILIRKHNTEYARLLTACDGLSTNQLAKLEKLILNSKDKSAIHTLTNVRFSAQTRKNAKEREKELSVSM